MGYFEDHLLPSEREAIPYIPVITEYLNFITEKYGDQIALSDPDQTVRYSELADRVARRRQALRALNLPVHGNIGLFDVNSIAEVEWFLAVTTAGYAAVMLPASLSPEVLKNASYHYDLIAVIAGSSLAEKAQGLPVPVLSMDDMADTPADPVPAAQTDRAAIFFTGGTTGTPKGVVLSHRAILRGSHNGTFRPGSMFGQTSVAVLPLTHVFGTIFGVLAGLYSGSHVAVCGNMRNLFKEMARVKPTTMVAVPGMAEMMLSIARSSGPEALGGRLNLVICGAAPVPPRLHAGFMEFGVDVKGGYGMTETANLVSANYDMDEYPTSVGQQYPCQESRIVDGELQVRGDMLFDEYWKDEATTKAAFDGDWLKTGDLARIDEKGYIYITGRIKNLILLPNGENVSPEEVEENFSRCPLVQECLVSETEIAGNPAILLEVFPVPDQDAQQVLAELRKISATLPGTMQPARIELRDQPFEKSPSMKIIRKK